MKRRAPSSILRTWASRAGCSASASYPASRRRGRVGCERAAATASAFRVDPGSATSRSCTSSRSPCGTGSGSPATGVVPLRCERTTEFERVERVAGRDLVDGDATRAEAARGRPAPAGGGGRRRGSAGRRRVGGSGRRRSGRGAPARRRVAKQEGRRARRASAATRSRARRLKESRATAGRPRRRPSAGRRRALGARSGRRSRPHDRRVARRPAA